MEFGMNATHRGWGMGIGKAWTSFRNFMRVAGAMSFLLEAGLLTAGGANAQTPQTETAKAAGMPQIENGKVGQRQAKAGLAQEVDAWEAASQQAQWLGYSVPAVNGDHRMCCGDSGGDWNGGRACGPCRLEGVKSGNSYNLQSGNVKLEGPSNLVVLVRAEGGKIGKIRALSEGCVLDAGGLQVRWLTGAKPTESVKLLERFVDSKELDERGGERLSRGALAAIAMHGDPSADQALARFTAPDK